ncbi:MAG: 30S ribosomal protein S6 [Deltaproteobacteria bacterium]|nr:30S ribosomal protein S6 [Deltaproteobacteria bacterium]
MSKSNAPIAQSTNDQRRARAYEMIYILRPGVHPDEADRIAARFSEIVKSRTGKLVNLNNWGRRRLAYPIKKESRGVFVYARFLGYEDLVAELERNLRLIDSVLRYQTILLKPRVDMDEITVDPADIEFQRLETAEEDEEPQLAQRLGLVEKPKGQEAEPDEVRSDQDALEDEYLEGGEAFNGFDSEEEYGMYETESKAKPAERQQRKKMGGGSTALKAESSDEIDDDDRRPSEASETKETQDIDNKEQKE